MKERQGGAARAGGGREEAPVEPARAPPPEVPPGYERFEASAFLNFAGPVYVRREGGRVWVGMRVDGRHLNTMGNAHGGLLATCADAALGVALWTSRSPPLQTTTVSLSIDYLAPAVAGDWLEAEVEITRVGRRVAFAECHVVVGGRRVLRASGAFAVMDRIPGGERKE
jgi:uncharacterized protein (TIGR00369 family)